MSGPPVPPETVCELTLCVGAGKIAGTVLRFEDGAARLRLCQGGDVGLVLDLGQVHGLRSMLADAAGLILLTGRRAA